MSTTKERPDNGGLVSVGQSESRTKHVDAALVESFAAVTGDENPLHLDDDHAAETMFGERIAHGMITAGLVSAALTDLVDPEVATVVYLSQTLEFQKPVYVDDELTATVEIVEDLGGSRYRLRTYAETDVSVVDGEAVILLST